MSRSATMLLLSALPALLLGCGDAEREQEGERTPSFQSLEQDPDTMRALEVLETVQARPPAGSPEVPPFEVVARRPKLTMQDCRMCHQEPLARETGEVKQRQAHVDIRLQHGPHMDCATCHDYDDLGQLRLLDDTAVGFNHSYRSCAQCHSEQAHDWVGGAHGKRLGGWRGRRVVQNCASCHDPHKPAIAPQFPVAKPTISEE